MRAACLGDGRRHRPDECEDPLAARRSQLMAPASASIPSVRELSLVGPQTPRSGGSRTWGPERRARPPRARRCRRQGATTATTTTRSSPPARIACRTPRRLSAPTIGQAVRAMKRPNSTGTTSDVTSRMASAATRTSTSPPTAVSRPAGRLACRHGARSRRCSMAMPSPASFAATGHLSPSLVSVGSAEPDRHERWERRCRRSHRAQVSAPLRERPASTAPCRPCGADRRGPGSRPRRRPTRAPTSHTSEIRP